MTSLLRNKYFLAGILLYIASVAYLHFSFGQSLSDFLITALILGYGFSALSYLVSKPLALAEQKASFKKEWIVIICLVGWIIFYTTYGPALINKLFPEEWLKDPKLNSLIIVARKLFFFVLVPFAAYKMAGFSLQDFGLNAGKLKFTKRELLLLVVLSIAALLFQYLISRKSKQLFSGSYSVAELLSSLPLSFLWLALEAGLVEEFFYRGFLQSRLSAVLRSNTGGIILTAVLFGLSHAPGLYLRGAESEGISEQLPFLFWSAYTIAYMSIAGIFLGIIYSRTKNLWLVIALHAMVDLLPNTVEFIQTWKRH